MSDFVEKCIRARAKDAPQPPPSQPAAPQQAAPSQPQRQSLGSGKVRKIFLLSPLSMPAADGSSQKDEAYVRFGLPLDMYTKTEVEGRVLPCIVVDIMNFIVNAGGLNKVGRALRCT
jgi:hypothetical protein